MLNFLTKGTEVTQNQRNRIERGRKAQLLQKDAKVYLHSAHGTDLCDNNGPIEARIPEGCLYITISKCGIKVKVQDEFMPIFSSKNPQIESILQNPTLPGNKAKLAKLLNIEEVDINIKYPGDSFVVNHLSPFAQWFKETNDKKTFDAELDYSGIIDREKLKEIYDPAFNRITVYAPEIKTETVTPSQNDPTFIKIIKDAVYNSFGNQQHLKKIEHKLNLILNYIYSNKAWYTKSELATAIYYLNNPHEDGIPEIEKYYSKDEITEFTTNEMSRLYNYIYNYFFDPQDPDTATLSKKDFQKKILNLSFRQLFSDIFLKFFEASVYPTKEDMKKLLDGIGATWISPDDFKLIDQFIPEYLGIDYKTLFTADSKLSNKYIMEKFPGIHYSLACRSVKVDCEKSAVLRRSVSEQQYESQQKYNEFIYGKNLSDPNNILYSDDDITIVRPGTFGSIPIIFKLFNAEGSCAEEIRWSSYNVMLPKNSMPISYDFMNLKERIQSLYDINLEDIENEIKHNYNNNPITLDKIITMDVDPYKTKVESTENYGKKQLLIDYLKNPIPENNRIDIIELPKNTPADWISSCYELQEISARPTNRTKRRINAMLLNYPETSTWEGAQETRQKLLNEKSKLNTWEKEKINAMKNKSKWKSTQKYGGGKRKKNRNKRTVKK